MYRCQICGKCTEAGQARLTHTVYRTVPDTQPEVKNGKALRDRRGKILLFPTGKAKQEIAREIELCTLCYSRLQTGITLERLREIVVEEARFILLSKIMEEAPQEVKPEEPEIQGRVGGQKIRVYRPPNGKAKPFIKGKNMNGGNGGKKNYLRK